MGIGMMLASEFWDGAHELVDSVVGGVGTFISKVLMGILMIVIGILKGILVAVGMSIGGFLCSMIDFIEVMFRLLAGLDVNGASMSIAGGDSGSDLLIQLIRNDVVQEAFLAMCIVGVFLLVMTTVFQIIRVEYTTEGAKNAKGPILEKTFKGLCNLMLIPILCIFGVFIGNQVLGLLDTATKGSQRGTIGRALFVASTGSAHYEPDDLVMRYDNLMGGAAVGSALLTNINPALGVVTIIVPALYGLVDSVDLIAEDFFGADSGWLTDWVASVSGNEAGKIDYKDIDNKFINGEEGYSLYNMSDVSKYYNILDINFILLIVGGAIIIKCLISVCFGLVLRLYYCTALFIVSPVVIGMTPVTDNLGKWRTSFVGKAISAYGVVIAMNLFFTITSVMTSIEFEFTSESIGAMSVFPDSLLSGIFRIILIIGGCLMIEKWSKEFGAYFGAEDAMSSGKTISKEIGDTAKKAVTTGVTAVAAVAAGVATAGAGTAAVGGLAAKMGTSMATKGAAMAGKKGLAGLAGKAMSKGGNLLDKGGKGLKRLVNPITGTEKTGAENAWDAKTQPITQRMEEADNEILHNEEMIRANNLEIASLEGKGELDAGDQARLEALKNNKTSFEQNLATAKQQKAAAAAEYELLTTGDSDEAKKNRKMKEASDNARDARTKKMSRNMVQTAAFGNFLKSQWEKSSIGSGFKAGVDQWQKYEKDGTSMSDEGVAAYGVVEEARKDRKKDRFEGAFETQIAEKNRVQTAKINQAMIEAINAQTSQTVNALQKLDGDLKELNNALGKMKDGRVDDEHSAYHGWDQASLLNRRASYEDRVKEAGGSVGSDHNIARDSVTGEIKVNINTSSIQQVMRKAIEGAWDQKKLVKELTALLQEEGSAGNKKLLDEILKAIDKLKSSTGK